MRDKPRWEIIHGDSLKPTPTGSAEKHTAAPFEQSAHHLQMERSAHEQAFPIKEKPVPPANTPQPKMREHTPTADAPVHLPQHPASQIYERPQNVYQLQTNRSVRELETSVREKPSASSLREIPAALKPDTTQFALPEIKAKEYIRSRRQKQHLLKEEASSIENTIADSETFSPVIRTRETVREQQKLHVSHSTEYEQPVMPQKPCPAKRRQLLQSRLQLSSAKGRYFEIRRSKRQKSQRKPERRFCGQSRQRQKSWPQRLAQAARRQFPLLW